MTVHELRHKDAHHSFHIRKGGKKEGAQETHDRVDPKSGASPTCRDQSVRRVHHTELLRAHSRARVHAPL